MTPSAQRYNQARFLDSVTDLRDLPTDSVREVAFAGRSNAGKSSALNLVAGRRSLAYTSKTPGRTRMINFFDLGAGRRIADLPGYGYARVERATRLDWQALLTRYLETRRVLVGTVLVADIRRGLTELDWRLIALAAGTERALHILLTKADKLGRGAGARTLERVRREVEDAGVEATLQLFSATARVGVDDAHGVLDEWFAFPAADAGAEGAGRASG